MGSNDSSLADRLPALQGNTEVLDFPDSYPDRNPIDVYRSYLSRNLARISGVDAKTIYAGLQWTQSLDKGDLNLAVPRLRVKGQAPNELAKRWAESVSMLERIERPSRRVGRADCF